MGFNSGFKGLIKAEKMWKLGGGRRQSHDSNSSQGNSHVLRWFFLIDYCVNGMFAFMSIGSISKILVTSPKTVREWD